MTATLDEFTFGNWWLSGNVLDEVFRTSTPKETDYLRRCVRGYRDVATLLGWATDWPIFGAFDRVTGELEESPPKAAMDRPPSSPHADWQQLSECEVRRELDRFLAAATAIGGDVATLGARLSQRWSIRRRSRDDVARHVCLALAAALNEGAPSVPLFLDAPVALEPVIDMAMFMPTPAGTPDVVLVSKGYSGLADRDPAAAARFLLAVSHEAFGHAAQFRALERSTRQPGATLDRELLEGWAIHREATLRHLGPDERALSDLYRAKRVLPLIRQATADSEWQVVRTRIESVWPGFFSSPETAVLRTAIGSHARGLIRVERLLALAPEPGTVSPWVAPSEPGTGA